MYNRRMRWVVGTVFMLVAIGIAAMFEPSLISEDEVVAVARSQPMEEPITVLFVGDIMFDRGVARHAALFGTSTLLAGVRELFEGNDAIMGNLEGTITTNKPVALGRGSPLRFTFHPWFASLLAESGFDAVSLANNHSMDFYNAGFAQTKSFLEEKGIVYFGSAYNNENLSISLNIKGKELCLVGYHDLYTYNEALVIEEIRRIRPDCYKVIAVPHWGEEYELEQSARQTDLAHSFIDAGADLVIGSHPHVVQPVEIYRGKAIFYSLGNFMFDQGLSFWTEHGLAVKATFKGDETGFELVATELDRAEASVLPPENESAKRVLGAANAERTFILK